MTFDRLLTIGAAVMTLALLALTTYGITHEPVSFDGAMNLQVAESLASGQGYVRDYAGIRAFPHEVQTNAPFLLPAALIFAVFGVGLVTAQMTNLLYLAGACAVAGWVVRQTTASETWPWLGALAVLVTPGILDAGANGYGELPGLAWWLAGTGLLFLAPDGRGARLGGGASLALAVLTKTVLLMPVAITVVAWGAGALMKDGLSPRNLRSAVAPAIGFLVPVLLVEAWRLAAVGGFEAYGYWWNFQFSQIGMQAGIAPGFEDTPGVFQKLASHVELLSGYLGLGLPALLAWLIAPLVAVGLAFRALPVRQRWFALALVGSAAAYFTWWLLVTPTEKAWHRRIFNGMVIVQLLWVLGAAWLTRGAGGVTAGRWAAALLLAGMVAQGLSARPFSGLPTGGVAMPLPGIERIESLPENALLLGEGWYSAPVIALYSGRPVRDLAGIPAMELDGRERVYALRDTPAQAAGAFSGLLATYGHETLFQAPGLELIAVDTRHRDPWRPALADNALAGVDTVLTRKGMPPASRGLFRDRWASTRVELVLEAGADVSGVRLSLFTPGLPYRREAPLRIDAGLDRCHLGEVIIRPGGSTEVEWPLPEACAYVTGDRVWLTLQADNMLSFFPRDVRQLSYVMKEVALTYAEATPESAPEAESGTDAMPEAGETESGARPAL